MNTDRARPEAVPSYLLRHCTAPGGACVASGTAQPNRDDHTGQCRVACQGWMLLEQGHSSPPVLCFWNPLMLQR
jgi:hypothetical protein